MTDRASSPRPEVSRWVRAVPFIFLLVGLSFGTWLSRLPAVRDQLGASASQMGLYGLCLASGSVAALIISGAVIQRFGARRVLLVAGLAAAVALPSAAAVMLGWTIPIGLALLFAFGFAFSICDVAISVSGANAEAALGKPRMPLMHAGYSLGAVAATGIGAVAEAHAVPVPVHLAIVMAASAAALLLLLRALPHDELAMRRAATSGGADPALAVTGPVPVVAHAGSDPVVTHTGAIPLIPDEHGSGPREHRPAPRRYSPWRDPRLIVIGVITLAFGIFEGTAADWLPLALVDGRGLGNDLGATMLSVFFFAALATRIVGSWLLERFGRVTMLRASAALAAIGVVLLILVPGTAAAVVGVVCWGIGSALGWPVTLSAAADDPEHAARAVAAVAGIGYGSMLVGPLAFGFLGDHFGLLTAFWALVPFAIYVVVAAGVAKPRAFA